jgi:hypothetical protein
MKEKRTLRQVGYLPELLLNQLHQNSAFAISHSKALTSFITSPACIQTVYLPRRSPIRFSRAMIL